MSKEELLDTEEVKDTYVGARNEHYGEQTEYYEECFNRWLGEIRQVAYREGFDIGYAYTRGEALAE